MSSENSFENQPAKVKIDDGGPCSQQQTPSSDFSENKHITVKMEEDETSQSIESSILTEGSAIKTEELFIITELPEEEDDQSVAPIDGVTSELFRCYLCNLGKLFLDKQALRVHLLTSHPQQKKYSCSECSVHRPNIVDFNKHLQRHDASLRPYKCQVCPIRFTQANSQKQHEAEIHQLDNGRSKRSFRKQRICPVCKKTVLIEFYDQHLHSEHSDAKLVCTICKAEFYSKHKLKQHKLFIHGSSKTNEEDKFKCYICKTEVLLGNHELLHQHLVNVHGNQSEYRCEECSYSSREVICFNYHLSSKHDPSKKPFKCNICQARFTEAKSVRYHKVSAHDIGIGKEHYDCTICHKQLASYRALSLHMRIHKSNQQTAQSETEVEDQNDKEGEKSPSSAKLFKCAHCTLHFTTERYRSYHVKAKHGCMRCYMCNTHTVLDSRGALKKHLREAHPRQTIYSCAQCEYTTGIKLAYNNHLAQHVPAIEYSCSICLKEFPTGSRLMLHRWRMGHAAPGNCPKNFVDNWSRTRREGQVHGVKSLIDGRKCNELKCYLCRIPTTFSNKRLLLKHFQTIHTTFAMYRCRKCTYSTIKQDQFNDHLARHDPVKRKFKCKSCSRRFLTARSKLFHEIFVHKKESVKVIKHELIKEPEQSIKTESIEKVQGHPSLSNKAAFSMQICFKCYLCETVAILESKTALLQHLATLHPHQRSYQCGECSVSCRSKTTFNQHLSRHDADERPYKCCVCSLRFLSNEKLKKHEIDAHAPQREKYDCSICGKSYSFQSTLTMHKFSHFNDRVKVANNSEAQNSETNIKTKVVHYKDSPKDIVSVSSKENLTIRCYLCDSVVKMDNEMALREHLLHGHPQQKVYRCNECNMCLNEITSFNLHLQQHDASMYPHKCSTCPLRFDKVESKNQHEVDTHRLKSGVPSNINAEECRQIQNSNLLDGKEPAESLITECDSQTISDETTKQPQKLVPKCYLCSTPTAFKTKNAVTQHMKANHPNKGEYQCKECDFTSTISQSFNNHQAIHDTDKPHKCSICTVRFLTEKTKKYHEASEHGLKTGVKVYTCPACAKNCSSKADLKRHQNNSIHCDPSRSTGSKNSKNPSASNQQHQKEKQYKSSKILTCYLCSTPQEFESTPALNKHLKFHVTQFTYKCNECDYTTLIKLKFNNHHREHDTSKLPYKCSICPKRFFTDKTRKFHEASQHRIETGTAVYPCSVCGIVFQYKSNLQEHRIDSAACARKSSAKDGPQEQSLDGSSRSSENAGEIPDDKSFVFNMNTA